MQQLQIVLNDAKVARDVDNPVVFHEMVHPFDVGRQLFVDDVNNVDHAAVGLVDDDDQAVFIAYHRAVERLAVVQCRNGLPGQAVNGGRCLERIGIEVFREQRVFCCRVNRRWRLGQILDFVV